MYRVLIASVVLFPMLAWGQHPRDQWEMSHTQVLAMIARLEADPMHDSATVEMNRLFLWIDKTEDAIVYIADADMNAIMDRRVPYNRNLYILLIAGMARYDLEYPDTDIEDPKLDRQPGFECMCTGYYNLRDARKVRKDRYFEKLCRQYLAP